MASVRKYKEKNADSISGWVWAIISSTSNIFFCCCHPIIKTADLTTVASFCLSLSGEGDMLPSTYLVDQKFDQLANSEVYAAQASDSLLYQNLLSGDSVSAQELVGSEGGTRDAMLFIPPNNVPSGLFCKGSLEAHCSEPISHHHGLSLSLGSQEQSLVNLHPDSNHYSNSGFSEFLRPDMQLGLQHHSQNDDMKDYMPFHSAKTSVDSLETLVGSNETSFMPFLNEGLAYTDVFCNSKYIKTAQDLLDELVSVHRESKPRGKPKDVNQDGSSRMDSNRDKAETPDSTKNNHHDIQNKLAKLSSILDEVDRRYKIYCHQLRLLVSSFDIIAGRGAAFPYMALTLKTISRQFRSLHDAIKKQIEASERSLGKQDGNSATLSRLRHVDEQLRHQKTIQHFGLMTRPWRPQRGLPETAISILRAWLFDHFLHPYPTDSEKLVLATRAGLSRSQVANWFINARVRLWKPMIEDIYKEEFGDEGEEPKSPPENTTTNQQGFDEREGGLLNSLTTTTENAMDTKRVKKSSVSLDLELQNNKDSSKTTEVSYTSSEIDPTNQRSQFAKHYDMSYGKMKLARPFDE